MVDDLKARLREEALALHSAAWANRDGGQQQTMAATLADEAADRIEKLEAAGNALAETIKITKASLVAGLTKRELGFLMGDLHNWNVVALGARATLSDSR